jgi:hypothetical protein
MNWTQQQDFIRSMPAVAAKILLMMLWTGRSLDGKEWAAAVDASDKTVSASLQWLVERGLAQDNGRLAGWGLPNQLPLPFKELWQGHSGVYLESESAPTGQTQETAWPSQVTAVDSQDNQPSGSPQITTPEDGPEEEEIGISDLSPINWLINSSSSEKELINQPINQSGEFGNSDLKQVMRSTKPPISGKVFGEFCRQRIEAALVLAWYWWCISQSWIDEPVGYVIQRVRAGEMPPADHLDLARFWLALDSDGRDNFRSQFDHAMLPVHRISDLVNEFDLSQAAAKLAVELRGLKVFEEVE